MKTADKEAPSTSPVHVHVEESAPVHVHVKKPKKPTLKHESRMSEDKLVNFGGSNLRRSATARNCSKSPSRSGSHWVPPPAKSSSGLGNTGSGRYNWQGPSHRLEMGIEEGRGAPANDTDDEEKNTSKMRKYEKKIDTLMNEVGTLRNQVELQRSMHELQRKDLDLEDTERALAGKEAELDSYRHELEATEVENRILRRSMDYLKEDASMTRSERERLSSERELLMKKLVEVELDGQAAAKQVAALRDVIRRLREQEEIEAKRPPTSKASRHSPPLPSSSRDFMSQSIPEIPPCPRDTASQYSTPVTWSLQFDSPPNCSKKKLTNSPPEKPKQKGSKPSVKSPRASLDSAVVRKKSSKKLTDTGTGSSVMVASSSGSGKKKVKKKLGDRDKSSSHASARLFRPKESRVQRDESTGMCSCEYKPLHEGLQTSEMSHGRSGIQNAHQQTSEVFPKNSGIQNAHQQTSEVLQRELQILNAHQQTSEMFQRISGLQNAQQQTSEVFPRNSGIQNAHQQTSAVFQRESEIQNANQQTSEVFQQNSGLQNAQQQTSEVFQRNSRIQNAHQQTSVVFQRESEIQNANQQTSEVFQRNSGLQNAQQQTSEVFPRNSRIQNAHQQTSAVFQRESEIQNANQQTSEVFQRNSGLQNAQQQTSEVFPRNSRIQNAHQQTSAVFQRESEIQNANQQTSEVFQRNSGLQNAQQQTSEAFQGEVGIQNAHQQTSEVFLVTNLNAHQQTSEVFEILQNQNACQQTSETCLNQQHQNQQTSEIFRSSNQNVHQQTSEVYPKQNEKLQVCQQTSEIFPQKLGNRHVQQQTSQVFLEQNDKQQVYQQTSELFPQKLAKRNVQQQTSELFSKQKEKHQVSEIFPQKLAISYVEQQTSNISTKRSKNQDVSQRQASSPASHPILGSTQESHQEIYQPESLIDFTYEACSTVEQSPMPQLGGRSGRSAHQINNSNLEYTSSHGMMQPIPEYVGPQVLQQQDLSFRRVNQASAQQQAPPPHNVAPPFQPAQNVGTPLCQQQSCQAHPFQNQAPPNTYDVAPFQNHATPHYEAPPFQNQVPPNPCQVLPFQAPPQEPMALQFQQQAPLNQYSLPYPTYLPHNAPPIIPESQPPPLVPPTLQFAPPPTSQEALPSTSQDNSTPVSDAVKVPMEFLRMLTNPEEHRLQLINTINIPPTAVPNNSPNQNDDSLQEKHLSSTDSAVLAKQKDLLVDRLGDFEETNRALRQLLRDRHEDENASQRLAEQRDMLLRKLTETEDRVQVLRTENVEKERRLQEVLFTLDGQKEENSALSGLQSSLENTRGHLQKQLRQKEGDCNRMAVQIRSLESQLAQERIEVDHLQQLLGGAKQKADQDKEALKKATRVQKQRASRSEDAVEQLQAQLLERDQRMAEVATDADSARVRLDKTSKEKAQTHAENAALKTRIVELEAILERVEDDSKATIDSATSRLQEKSAEATTYKLDVERLKVSLANAEDKSLAYEEEIAQLRSSVRQYETMVEEYRGQMNKSRREADETIMQLEEQKRETERVAQDGECEIDKVKSRLQARLQELEPIPELLQSTELRLQDTTERLHMAERRNGDNTRLIAELTAKIEQQSQQMGTYRDKIVRTSDTNRSLEAKLDSMDKKLKDIEDQNRELLQTVAKREEAVHHATVRLDERGHENASLQRQLEAALQEARRQTDVTRDKAANKERTCQQRILDLEGQLSQARADNARIKREKEEAERKFNSRLYDLKDRLEQSHATNRSMQNYVQFLKSSYANVFSDASFTASSPVRGGGGAGFHSGM